APLRILAGPWPRVGFQRCSVLSNRALLQQVSVGRYCKLPIDRQWCHKTLGCSALANTTNRVTRSVILNAEAEKSGDNHENRSDRRQWTHRIKTRQEASSARARTGG